MTSELVLKDVRIAIQQIAVKGWLYDDIDAPLNWSIDVVCEKHHFADDWNLAPRFYDDCFAKDLRDWTALAHTRFVGDNDEDEDSFPTLYLCSHMHLPRSEIAFGEHLGTAAGFTFSWNGLADANLDSEYGKEMPFSITGVAEIVSVEVRFNEPETGMHGGAEAAAREVLRRREVPEDHLAFSDWKRFRDDPEDRDFHTIRAFFIPR
jgi:hypothetical protein